MKQQRPRFGSAILIVLIAACRAPGHGQSVPAASATSATSGASVAPRPAALTSPTSSAASAPATSDAGGPRIADDDSGWAGRFAPGSPLARAQQTPDDGSCAKCDAQCSGMAGACDRGSRAACYEAASCLCLCQLQHGGCDRPIGALQTCVTENRVNAGSFAVAQTPEDRAQVPPPVSVEKRR